MKIMKLFLVFFVLCFCLHKTIYTDIRVRVYKYKSPTKIIFIDRYNSRYEVQTDSTTIDKIKKSGLDHILRKYDDDQIKIIK